MPDFGSMNETDVREAVVRPFLESLGYRHGTQATIRTEVPLRYNKAFLGRKNPAKDPVLGRADYICEAIGYGRWVVEVKSPSQKVGRDDIEQAHTYAAHPEIAALYFLVTNGRDYQLYMTSRLEAPLLRWTYDDIEELHVQIGAILEFDAIKKYATKITPDTGRPLAKGLPSKLRMLGGEIVYGSHTEISTSQDEPTIFKNIQTGAIEEGEIIDGFGMGPMPCPFTVSFEVFSEAIGYYDGEVFKGIVSFDYRFLFHPPAGRSNLEIGNLLAKVPPAGNLIGEGEFTVRFADS